MSLKPVIDRILLDYELSPAGDHGVSHWARVHENGERLVAATGADSLVVRLFAVIHDSQRINEATDDGHGRRAARFAERIRRKLPSLTDHQFELLYRACEGHTDERTHSDVTIQVCWDSDRLDLGRVGISPHPDRLCTEFARRPEIINWADGRGRFRVIPEFVLSDWGVDLSDPHMSRDRTGG